MKIAIFNYGSSGLFHYATSLAKALLEYSDDELIFFTSSLNNLTLVPSYPRLRLVAQAAPHTLGQFMKWGLNQKEQNRLSEELRLFNPNVIHITDEFPIYPRHHFLLRRFPIIFTQHDPVSHAGERYQLATRLLQKYLQSMAATIVVHGESLRSELIKHTPAIRSKITVIPLGEQSILLNNSIPIQPKKPHSILFFGRIVDYKGLDTLLESLLILQNRKYDFHFILAGAGSLKKYTHLLDRVKNKEIYNHYIPDNEVSDCFQRSEIIVLPYLEGTQSSVAAIALSASIPIIASRVGALPEILVDHVNSLLVSPKDPEALADSIQELLENDMLRQRLISAGKKTVREKLSWPEVSKKYRQVYYEAI